MAAIPSAPVTTPGLESLIKLATVHIHQSKSGYHGNNYTVLNEGEPLFSMNEDVPDTIFRGGARRAFIFDGVENTGRKDTYLSDLARGKRRSYDADLHTSQQAERYSQDCLPSGYLDTYLSDLARGKRRSYDADLHTSQQAERYSQDCLPSGYLLFRFLRPTGRVFFSDIVELYIDYQLASVIRMERTFMTPIFSINDPLQQPVIRLKAKLSKTTTFELQTNTKIPIGSIQKKWRGWKEEFFSYNDDFIINFPADLAVQYKLAVIVACVYIDFSFHEGRQVKREDHRRTT